MPENKGNGSRSNGGSHAEHLEEHLELAVLPGLEEFHAPLAPPTLASSVFELDLYQELNSAKNIAELGEKMLGLVNQLGFSDYSFTRTDFEDLGDLMTLPVQLQSDYEKGGFFEFDLLVDYANNNNAPIFDSVIEEYVRNAPFDSDIIRQNRERFRMFRSHGYFLSYLIPAKQNNGTNNILFGLATKGESPIEFFSKVEKSKTILRLIAEAADYVTSIKFLQDLWGTEKTEKIRIGSRPLQLLTVMAKDDLTLNEAANRLCISIHTANQHIAAARKAFGAHTTTGAVCKAANAGLIIL